jgi:hypothetical protein
MIQQTGKRFVCTTLAAVMALQTTSCGTLLYPERRGQPAGRLDAGVVALDAVGLLLFLVPGVIAFAVDFATGTIYLPSEPHFFPSGPGGLPVQTVHLNVADLTPQKLEAVVSEQTGRTIHLETGTYRAGRIDSIQEFTPTTLNGLQSSPVISNVTFRAKGD